MNTEILYTQALALEQKGDYSKTAAQYKYLVTEKEDPKYYIAYGVCLQKLKHWKQSIKMLEKGISLKPHYAEGDARLFLATSYIKSGETKKAIRQWRIAEKMDPEYPSYENIQNEAKNMLAKST